MSHRGEPGHPGQPGEAGAAGGGRGGSGGEGGHGGTAPTGMTPGARHAAVFLFILSLFLAAGNFLFTSNLVHRSAAATASVTQLCQSGNEFRAEQVQLWEFLISVSRPPPHETPAMKTQREKVTRLFVAHIHQVFKPRDCSKE